MVKVVTWNVNSIASRLTRVLQFLARESPDYLCLQELKCVDEKFPLQEFTNAGYHAVFFGQKAYNGVAIISKKPVELRFKNFGDIFEDASARCITARCPDGFDLICAYVPNGQSVGSDKFQYKMTWLEHADKFIQAHWKPSDPLIFVGDFNIAPDDRDVYDPIKMAGHIHCSHEERQKLAKLLSFGFVDTLRVHRQEGGIYSWWDYRELSFVKNLGLRIDLIYATAPLAIKCRSVVVDREERKGEKPSDHAPVVSTFEL